MITGKGSRSGQYMLEHKGFRKLAFTGSTEIGCNVAAAAAKRLIPSTLELGGKSANIYFPDCQWGYGHGWPAAGHSVQSRTKFAVPVHEFSFTKTSMIDLWKIAVKAFDNIKVGMPWEEDTQMGVLQFMKRILMIFLNILDLAKEEGAEIALWRPTPLPKGNLPKAASCVPL